MARNLTTQLREQLTSVLRAEFHYQLTCPDRAEFPNQELTHGVQCAVMCRSSSLSAQVSFQASYDSVQSVRRAHSVRHVGAQFPYGGTGDVRAPLFSVPIDVGRKGEDAKYRRTANGVVIPSWPIVNFPFEIVVQLPLLSIERVGNVPSVPVGMARNLATQSR